MADKAEHPTVDDDVDIIDNFGGPDPADAKPAESVTPEPSGDDSPPEPSATEPVVTPSSDVAESPEFPQELLARVGLTQEQAAAEFGDPEVLERAIRWHDKQIANYGRQRMAPPQRPPQQQAPPPQQQQQPPTEPEFKMWEKFELPKRSDGEYEFDDATVKLLQQQDAHYQKQFERMIHLLAPATLEARDAAMSLQRERQQEQGRRWVEEMDRRFTNLGDDWKDVFGEGSGFEIVSKNPQATELQNRARVDLEMRAIAEGRAATGLQALNADHLFQRALETVFQDKIEQSKREKLSGQVRSRRGLQGVRPTARKTPAPSKDTRTLEAVDKLLRSKGRSGLDLGSDDFDGEI